MLEYDAMKRYDYTDRIVYTGNKPTFKVKQIAGIEVVLPKGVSLKNTGGKFALSVRNIAQVIRELRAYERSGDTTVENVLKAYGEIIDALAACEQYCRMDHSAFLNTGFRRPSLSRMLYEYYGLTSVSGITLTSQSNGRIRIMSAPQRGVDGSVLYSKIVSGSKNNRETIIRCIKEAILTKDEKWLSGNLNAQEFLKK